jgi:hypothetical protein
MTGMRWNQYIGYRRGGAPVATILLQGFSSPAVLLTVLFLTSCTLTNCPNRLAMADMPEDSPEHQSGTVSFSRTGPLSETTSESRPSNSSKAMDLPISDRPSFDQWTALGMEALFPLLEALETSDPVAKNWTRAAVEKIVADSATPLPSRELLDMVRDRDATPDSRRLALRLLEQAQPGSTSDLWKEWLEDPVFGTGAVSRLLDQVDELLRNDQQEMAEAELHRALRTGLAFHQAEEVAKRLRTLQVSLDLPEILGVVRDWHAIGPFPVTADEGLRRSFFPEEQLDFSKRHRDGELELRWTAVQADSEDGRVDLVSHGIAPSQGSVAYAATHVELAESRDLVLLASAVDNLTVWVNGGKVLHHASLYRSHYRQDRYRAEVSLPEGTTTILVKLCKTPPDTERAEAAGRLGAQAGGRPEKWDFMVRWTDLRGRGVSRSLLLPNIQ